MQNLIHSLAKIIITPVIFAISLFGHSAPVSNALGSTNAIETPVALFQTSLANSITSSSNSMTLVSGTTLDNTNLASSTYSFVIEEGTASQEFVKADCTNTTCTNMDRGLSSISGTTTVAGLAKAHRRGASVKVTDAPLLLNITRILNGIGTIPNVLSYTTAPTFTNGLQLVDKTYADAGVIAGGVVGSNSTPGIFIKATGLQAASTTGSFTYNATAYSTLLPASISTSSPYAPGLYIPVTQNNGTLNPNFISTSSVYVWSGNNSYTGTSLFNGASTFNVSPTFGTFDATSSLVTSTSTIAGNLTIAKNASTTNLIISGTCTGCVAAPTIVTATNAGCDTSTGPCTVTATCSGSQKVVGGGGKNQNVGSSFGYENYPSATNAWTYTAKATATGGAYTVNAYAICQ